MQIIYQRIGLAPSSFMDAQEQIIPVYGVRLFFGVLTIVGLLMYLYSFFVKTKTAKA
jgi:cbb3-type cytochrome oxidase subunit 1